MDYSYLGLDPHLRKIGSPASKYEYSAEADALIEARTKIRLALNRWNERDMVKKELQEISSILEELALRTILTR